MQERHRNSYDIIANFLYLTSWWEMPSRLMYATNLSWKLSRKYLDLMVKIHLLDRRGDIPKCRYRRTDKGNLFLSKYNELKALVEATQ